MSEKIVYEYRVVGAVYFPDGSAQTSILAKGGRAAFGTLFGAQRRMEEEVAEWKKGIQERYDLYGRGGPDAFGYTETREMTELDGGLQWTEICLECTDGYSYEAYINKNPVDKKEA